MARESLESASASSKSSSSGSSGKGSAKGSSKGSAKGGGEGPSKGKLIAVGAVFVVLVLVVIFVNRPDSQEAEDRKEQEAINAASVNDPVPEQKSGEFDAPPPALN